MSSITSEEVNYLVYRYLQEAGFTHSAYCFGQESFIVKADIKASNVPPGALISLLQKGLHYVSIETHLNEDGTERECSRPFSLLEPHECERPIVDVQADDFMEDGPMVPKPRGLYGKEPEVPVAMVPSLAPPDSSDLHSTSTAATSNNIDIDDPAEESLLAAGKKNRLGGKKKKRTRSTADINMDIDAGNADPYDEDVTFLREGLKENITVVSCAPSDQIRVCIGTGDGWLQLWDRSIPLPQSSLPPHLSPTRPIVPSKALQLTREFDLTATKDITTINWRPDCKYVAVASVEGNVRIINGGAETQLPPLHQGPVFAAKWSPSGAYLLTAGLDKTAVIWDVASEREKRVYRHHQGPIMDVDWRTDGSFATCSVDRTIAVYNDWTEQAEPVQIFMGHEDEVNSIAWDPTRTVLASCSDDCTARLWRTSQPSPIHTLSDHKKEIYTIKWSPVESRSGAHWLATASLDSTVRLWDAETGKCVRTLAKHSDAVFAVAFSPDGDYLATGARDSAVHIWSLREGVVVRSFNAGPGGALDLSWTKDGRSLIASSSNDICVFDMPSAGL